MTNYIFTEDKFKRLAKEAGVNLEKESARKKDRSLWATNAPKRYYCHSVIRRSFKDEEGFDTLGWDPVVTLKKKGDKGVIYLPPDLVLRGKLKKAVDALVGFGYSVQIRAKL